MLSPKSAKTILVLLLIVSLFPLSAFSATKEELQAKITQALLDKEKVEKEISALSTSLNDTSKQKQTLTSTLNALELTRKKLVAELNLTQKNIQVSTLNIENLTNNLSDTEQSIQKNSSALSESLIRQSELESESLIEMFLKYRSLSEAWDHMTTLFKFEREIQNAIATSKDLEEKLTTEKASIEAEKKTLVSYQAQLSDKKTVVDTTTTEKNKLLSDTKNKEAEYQKLLADKVAQRTVYENQLFDFESQLRIAIDPNSIPGARTGVLSWPFDQAYLAKCPIFQSILGNSQCVTQYFGYTAAAAKLYKTTGKHGGVDFRATIGTPVYAALSGIVTDTEAIKTRSGCQYGKWVLIKHPNGLSTIYGHLSLVKISPGDTVITGQLVGYSGDTGFATGPHLHFGVYATQGIRIVDSGLLSPTSRCTGIKTVASAPEAYLDPLTYLPTR